MQMCFEDLVVLGVDAEDAEDAIRQIGKLLYDGGYVKETYIDAVAEREKEYPTGLILQDMQIAMPHTMGIHVNRPAVCVAKLAHPVIFGHMGDPDTKVEAEMLFMMAIQDPNAQIDTLQNMMGVFTNHEAAAALKAASTEEELFSTARKYIG